MTDRDAYWRGLFNVDSALKIAVMSDDRAHRYWLTRIWDRGRPILVVCMFNPSTADGQRDDPTILRLCAWAKLWGYGGIRVVNLFAFRASSPAVMMAREDAVGPENAGHIKDALIYARVNGGKVLVAWGNDGDHRDRAGMVDDRSGDRTHSGGEGLLGERETPRTPADPLLQDGDRGIHDGRVVGGYPRLPTS